MKLQLTQLISSGTNLVFTFTDNLPADDYTIHFFSPARNWGTDISHPGGGLGVRDTGITAGTFENGQVITWAN